MSAKLTAGQVKAENLRLHSTQDRPIHVYEARTPKLISEKWGVDKLPENFPKIARRLMVLGTGRCGTHNVSKLFKLLGVDVDHEIVGSVGTSSHYFMVDSDWYPMHVHMGITGNAHVGQRLSDYSFEHVVHIVRNPLITISSITEIFKPLEYEFYEDNGIIPTENRKAKKREYRGMVLWYYVNKYIDDHFQYAPVLKIEDINVWWEDVCDMATTRRIPKPDIGASNKSSWRTQSHLMTTSEIFTIDADLALKIFALAKKYGYDLFA